MMEIRSPRFTADGRIDCEIEHPQHGWIPFTASPVDVEAHGRAIYDAVKDIADPYVPVPETAPTIEDERAAMVCTPLQMRRALRKLGQKAAVDAYIAQQDEDAQEAWEYASEIRRLDPLTVALVAVLGTPEQGDDLFRLAQTL